MQSITPSTNEMYTFVVFLSTPDSIEVWNRFDVIFFMMGKRRNTSFAEICQNRLCIFVSEMKMCFFFKAAVERAKWHFFFAIIIAGQSRARRCSWNVFASNLSQWKKIINFFPVFHFNFIWQKLKEEYKQMKERKWNFRWIILKRAIKKR